MTFGVHVIASIFQIYGHSPLSRHAFSICVGGTQKYFNNFFTMIAGISLGGVDGLVFTFKMYDSTYFSFRIGNISTWRNEQNYSKDF